MGALTEFRLIAYLALGLGVLLGAGGAGAKLTSMHYEATIDKQQLAQDAVVQAKQDQIIALQRERDLLQDQVRKDHDTMVAADTAARTAVTTSLRNAEDAVRAITLFGPVANSRLPAGTRPIPGSDPELERAIADANAAVTDVNGALETTIAKCQHDSTELTNILALVPKPTKADSSSVF